MLPASGMGAMKRPSDCIHFGRPVRNIGKAMAMRSRRVAFGNCLRITTTTLASTASAIGQGERL